MKLAAQTYPEFEGDVKNISVSFYDKVHVAECDPIYQSLQKIRNSKRLFPQRRSSLPGGDDQTEDRLAPGASSSSFALRRSRAFASLHRDLGQTLSVKCVLTYHCIHSADSLDADNYIYLGSVYNGPFLQQGLTLDPHGRLLLIKGKPSDLLTCTWSVVKGAEKYQVAGIDLGEYTDLVFENIRINDDGAVIVKQKLRENYYQVNISTENLISRFDLDDGDDMPARVVITLKKIVQAPRKREDLDFELGPGRSISLHFCQGRLCLKQLQRKAQGTGNALVLHPLALPLAPHIKLLSATPCFTRVKLVASDAGRLRIFYLSAHHVDIPRRRVTHLSHKPPQGLYSGTGGDPHERVSSGQPFDSRRWGNFSSRHIPLFSSVVDNFRIHLKRAKNHHHRGNKRSAAVALAQAVDPGFQCLVQTVKTGLSNPVSVTTGHKPERLSQGIEDIRRFIHLNASNKTMAGASSYLDGKAPAIDAFRFAIAMLGKNDSITLSEIFDMSCFFGVAAAGLPFMPGWFAGALARFNRQFSLSVAKLDNNNIKFCYQKIAAKSAVALGGTGQGLEDRCKIYSRGNVDYGTILPLEVNAIFVSNVFSLRSFSFDLAQQHLDALFAAFSPTVCGAGDTNLEHLIENAILVREKKSGVSLLAEAKSEIRAQVGFMADPATFLVLPRVGLGVAGTLSIFDIQQNKQETRTFVDNKGVSEEYSSRQQAFFAASLYAYQESKIMPIEMASIPADSKQLYCFPLPLVEQCRQNLPTTRHPLARHYRMDGAVLKLTGQPYYISGAELPAMKNETPLPVADGLDYGIDEIIGQLLEKSPLPLMDLILAAHERIKHAAANDIGYQILKPAANLSMFVVSRGDDKRGLLAIAQQGMPNIQRCRKENKVSFQRSLNRLLMPWKRDTTLGEYLAEKKLASRMNHGARRRTPANAFDFIQALERYVVRNTRHSLGKRAAITALATYKLQPGVLKRIADDFCSLLREIQDELSCGRGVDRYVAAVADIATVFNIQRPQSNPFLQLDSISLVKHHTLTRQVGTIPCTVLSVARKQELTYSTPLDAIRFEYRGMELFPCRMVSSLAIMPDLFQFNREYVP